MKKLLLITILFAINASCIYSQTMIKNWANPLLSISGTGNVNTQRTKINSFGEVVAAGFFTGQVDLDPSTAVASYTSNGLSDIFIATYDAAGNFLSATTFGGAGDDYVQDMVVDATSNIYVTGQFGGTINFGTAGSKTSVGGQDVFVLKLLRSVGSISPVWVKTFGGTGLDVGYGLVLAPSVLTDAIWITGAFTGTVDFNPDAAVSSFSSNGSTDIFLTRLDLSGNYLSSSTHGSTLADAGLSIAATSAEVFITGYIGTSTNFGPSGMDVLISGGGPTEGTFITKYSSSSGIAMWAKGFFSSFSNNRGTSIVVNTNTSDVYTVGKFTGTADFNPSSTLTNDLTAGGTSDGYICKLDYAGNYNWAGRFGGSGADEATSVTVDSNTGVSYVLGKFAGNIGFTPLAASTLTLNSVGSGVDMVLARYSNGGSTTFAGRIGSSNAADEPRSVNLSSTGHVYLAGSTTGPSSGTTEFNFTGGSSGAWGYVGLQTGFLAKYYPCDAFTITASSTGTLCAGQSFSLNATAGLSSYVWSGPNSYTSSVQTPTINNSTSLMSGTYTLTGVDANGCSGSATTTVSVITNTNVVASVVTQTICEGNNFVLNASGGNTYLWNGPNSYTSAVQSPTISNSALAMSGIYSVTATPTGGCAGTSTVNITVNSLPTPSITNLGPFCAGSTATLNASGASTYIWTAPASAGSFTSSAQNFTFTALNGFYAGTYYLAGISVAGCVNTTTTNVIVISAPNATASNAGPYCVGNTIALSATGGGTYAWSGPLSYTSSVQNPIIINASLAQAGIYTVTTTFSGCAKTATTNVVVNPIPAQPVNLSSSIGLQNNVCSGNIAEFYVGANCDWYTSATGGTSFLNSNSYSTPTLTTTTTYYVDRTVNGCTSAPRVALVATVNPMPSVISQTVQNLTCNGSGNGSISLTLNNPSSFSYDWTPNVSTTYSATSLSAGIYTVQISSGVGLCVTTQTYNVTQPAAYNVPVNVLANGTILGFGDSYTGSPSFQWVDCNNSNAPIAGATNATFTPTITGSYALTFGYSGCVSTSTCNVITVTTTGLNENTLLNAISLQPNPASTFFTLSNVADGTTVNVMDVTGKVIVSNSVIDGDKAMTIETDNLSNGIYVIQLKNNGAVAHRKLIISK
ncbi:MAG TPA: T9SS type A sorting domain-containing protein [Bacteroidia bacterium]|nr:T9SS type A sorting domain-containing protein [Bacteroidia bacterium]